MQRDELQAQQRILAQCSGLHSWLQASDEREPARARLQRELGDRLFCLVVGGLAPRAAGLAA